MRIRLWTGVLVPGLLGLALLAGCSSDKITGNLLGNQRPLVQLSARPQPQDSVFYSVRLQWFASDEDGQVVNFIYAVDPPADGDTAWIPYKKSEITLFFRSSEPDSASIAFPFPANNVVSRDYHVFVIKAIDNEALASRPEYIAFTSETVAPITTILEPAASSQIIAQTAPSVTIRWNGQDPDGVLTQKPVKYYFKLVSQTTIQNALSLGSRPPSPGDLQKFFAKDLPSAFASWDSVPAESTFKQFEGLTPGQIWYFAVSGVDEAHAYEPRFSMGNNVLRFKPATELRAATLTVYNTFFERTQSSPGINLDEDRVVQLEVPESLTVTFLWSANPTQGTAIAGYRWALDLEDVFDETPRDDESQTYRWSSWSLSEQQANVGPFYTTKDKTPDGRDTTISLPHRFYVEVRDNVGSVSLMIIEMAVVPPAFLSTPSGEERFLVFDDFRGNPDRLANEYRPYASYPTEAVLDSMLYAVGGTPYKWPNAPTPGPGVFAGFPYDTLDYRFTVAPGLPLSVLTKYNAVVWYTDQNDAGRTGTKFSGSPSGALRLINMTGELNTLAVYLSMRGNAWLFGAGIAKAVANGYVTRFGASTAFYPFQGGGTRPNPGNILWPGDFLYDYMKLWSELDLIGYGGAGDPLSSFDNLYAMTPYLPEYRTPGAPWPPEGWPGKRGEFDDPRVGPASERNVGRWAGLPFLKIPYPNLEFDFWPSPLPSSTDLVPYIGLPNVITEVSGGEPVLDTLYLYRAGDGVTAGDPGYRLRVARDWPDGKPVWVHYHGANHGQVNWTSAPLEFFARQDLRLVADRIMGQFGFQRRPDPRTWTGPGSLDVRDGQVVAGQ